MARSNAEARLNLLSNSAIGDNRRVAQEISQIMREYIGDKLSFQGTALTVPEMETLLKEREIQDSSIQRLCRLLERCESVQYATVGGTDDFDALTESRTLIHDLENLL